MPLVGSHTYICDYIIYICIWSYTYIMWYIICVYVCIWSYKWHILTYKWHILGWHVLNSFNSYIVLCGCDESPMVWGSLTRQKFVMFKKEGPSRDSQCQRHSEEVMPNALTRVWSPTLQSLGTNSIPRFKTPHLYLDYGIMVELIQAMNVTLKNKNAKPVIEVNKALNLRKQVQGTK